MVHPYQILLPLLSLFWVRVDLTDLFPIELPVKVVEIRDGDTVKVRFGLKTMIVRLSKIDAPELNQNFLQSKLSAGKFSKKCLAGLLPDEGILSIEGVDIYHRILGDMNGVNLRAVENGCAGLYPHANFPSVREKWRFLRALTEAKKSRRGVWAFGGYMLPKKWRKLSKRSAHPQSHRRPHSRATYPPGRRSGRTED